MDETQSRIIIMAAKMASLKGRTALSDADLIGVIAEAISYTQELHSYPTHILYKALTELIRRVITQLPVPTQHDDNGKAIYTTADVMRAMGVPGEYIALVEAEEAGFF